MGENCQVFVIIFGEIVFKKRCMRRNVLNRLVYFLFSGDGGFFGIAVSVGAGFGEIHIPCCR